MSKLGRLGVRLTSTLLALAAVSLVALLVVIPRLTAGAALTVLTGSMNPSIPPGSIVLVVPQDPAAIEPGDVITFQTAPGVAEYITHRVARVQRDTQPMSFITKGDANNAEDVAPVSVDAVRGVVRWHAPYIGTASEYARRPAGLLVIVLVPALLIVLSLVRTIARELSNNGSRRSIETPSALETEAG